MAYFHCGRSILRQIGQGTTHRRSDGLVHPLLYVGHGVRYRKLEVILTTNMDKLGKAGETVKVAPGYFRNYLMPKLLAVPNIERFAYSVREQRKIYQPKEDEEIKVEKDTEGDKMKEYIAAAKRLDNAKLTILIIKLVKKQWLQNDLDSKGCHSFPDVLKRFFKVDNELREPVTKDEIVAEVARQLNVQIALENLHLPTPLSSFGEYAVPLRLPKSIPLPEGKIMWTLNVKIRRK